MAKKIYFSYNHRFCSNFILERDLAINGSLSPSLKSYCKLLTFRNPRIIHPYFYTQGSQRINVITFS